MAWQAKGVPAGTVIASGLANPRGLNFAKNGDIWIAEAGSGRRRTRARPGEEGGDPACFGTSGAFTLVHNGSQKRVVTGLPSFGDQATGDSALGASDILVNGKHVVGLIGGGGGADRARSARRRPVRRPGCSGTWSRSTRGTARSGRSPISPRTRPPTTPTRVSIDSDSYGLLSVTAASSSRTRRGNDVLGVDFKKQISTLAVFPDAQVPRPAVPRPARRAR